MDYTVLKKAIDNIIVLPHEDFRLLSTCTTYRQLKKGEALLKQGEICRSFFFVESGYLRTWYNRDGISVNQDFTFEGSFTSVIKSLREHQPSDLNISAGEKSIVWIIGLDSLPEEVAVRPQLARFVKKVALRLLLTAEKHTDLLQFYTLAERYQYIEKNNPELLQRVSLSQIASYIGMARETLSRIRARTT